MSVGFVVSVLLNLLLAGALVLVCARFSKQLVLSEEDNVRLQNELRSAQLAMSEMREQSHRFVAREIAPMIAESVTEIRRDIDRNYEHTHDTHVLNLIARELLQQKVPAGVIWLDAELASDIRRAGGAAFVLADGSLTVQGALAFAWHLHAAARERAGTLCEVVKESCGPTDRAAWLSKSLALWERICGHDQREAIELLTAAVEDWRRSGLSASVRPVRIHD